MRSDRSGSTLVTVTVVMTVIGISLALFLKSQTATMPSFTQRKLSLQAIANARSAVLQAQAEMKEIDEPDTGAINESLFEDENQWQLWKDKTFGSASFETASTPFVQQVVSVGEMKGRSYKAVVEMGSKYTPGDTVLLLIGKSVLEASGISGTKVMLDSAGSSADILLNKKSASQSKKWLEDQFADMETAELDMPLVIRSHENFAEMADTITGDLFIDGSGGEFMLNGGEREIYVLGDIQVTGKVTIRNLSALVAGELRLNDQGKMQQNRIATLKKVFLDGESEFSGELVSLDRIEIFNTAKVLGQSLIVSFGGKEKKVNAQAEKKTPETPEKAPEQKTSEAPEPAPQKQQKASASGAINIREFADVSASCIALGSEGIMTESDAKSSGVLWSKTWIRHRGSHKGLLRAELYDGEPGTHAPQEVDPVGNKGAGVKQPKQQIILGRVEPPFEKATYPLPWFMGEPEMVKWVESNETAKE